jgi:D-alanyl-D-alanine dipeptidase
MNFSRPIDELRFAPIPIDTWRDTQVGDNNDGPYKQNYPKIPVNDDTNRELVDLSEFGLVSSDAYMDQLLRGDSYLAEAFSQGLLWSRALARPLHARLLARADAFLRANSLFLFVSSAWRHPDLQKLITSDFAAKHGADQARRMFAPVLDGHAPPPHSTGAAFDLEIWSLETSSRLEMYYTDGSRNVYNAYAMEKLALGDRHLTDDAFLTSLRNRRILYHVLCTKGVVFSQDSELFCNHPGEFWHFGIGDPLSAYLSRELMARYGAALPPRVTLEDTAGSMHSPKL